MLGIEQTVFGQCFILAILPGLVERYCVKVAVIFAVPNTASSDVCWRWRPIDGKTDSKQSFGSYEDCLENAKANGYLYHHIPSASAKPPGTAVAGNTGATRR
jgi:hypothetical protein